VDFLGVQALRKAGRADDVHKHHADLAQRLLENMHRGHCGQFVAQRQQRRIDYCIAQEGTLGFEPCDDVFERLGRW